MATSTNKGAIQDTILALRTSPKLVFSYVLDWVIIICFAGAGGLLSLVRPYHRPFSLVNLDIANPVVHEQISVGLLGFIAFVAPAIIIAVITIFFVPGSEVRRVSTKAQVLRIKLWELERGLAGLCLSVAVGFFVVQGMKNLFGKPRPNLLARCEPDLSNIEAHVVGSFAQEISPEWVLVNSSICQQADTAWLDDGFRSFPSGHSQWSWSGLLYLALFFCSKFSVGLPELPIISGGAQHFTTREPRQIGESGTEMQAIGPRPQPQHDQWEPPDGEDLLELRDTAASPPNYLIIPAMIPVAVAMYVCSTRYVEFYHFGFDIISGSLIGIATAWLSFRFYHLPIGTRGRGWAWGARSSSRAFAIGVGTPGYIANHNFSGPTKKPRDLETGRLWDQHANERTQQQREMGAGPGMSYEGRGL